MSVLVVVGIGVLGGIGAVSRMVVDGVVSKRVAREFPYGTLIVNVSGSFVLGVLVGAAVDSDVFRVAGTGLIGAYTTFSTWAFESHRLGEDGRGRLALLNFAVSIMLGVTVAWAGRHVGDLI